MCAFRDEQGMTTLTGAHTISGAFPHAQLPVRLVVHGVVSLVKLQSG